MPSSSERARRDHVAASICVMKIEFRELPDRGRQRIWIPKDYVLTPLVFDDTVLA